MRRIVAGLSAVILAISACSSSSTPAPSSAAATPAGTSASTAPSAASSSAASTAAGGSFDPSAISGTAILSGWQSSPAEGNALTQTLLSFQSAYPNVKVDYQPLGGDYAAGMAAKFASGDVPDVFYVDAGYAQQWIDQGYLAPLDDYIAKSGFDTSPVLRRLRLDLQGHRRQDLRPAQGRQHDRAWPTTRDLVPTPPKTMDELVTLATVAQGQGRPQGAAVPEPGPRPRARLPLRAGRLAAVRRRQDRADRHADASKTAVQWYMDLFKNGLGMSAADLGDDWCGTSLGKKHAAIIFEGGWLDPAMTSTYPDVKYAWAAMPTGSSGSPVTISYTVSYSIGADSKNKDQGWVLLSYLTGVDGMTKWTAGRRRPAVAQGRPDAGGQGRPRVRGAPMPSPARASCPATTTSRRRSRTRSPTRSRRRRSTRVPSSTRPRRRSTRR